MRRAMGKKKADVMAALKVQFIEGCKENSIEDETANTVFNLMNKFASYGFNKSHSAAYALISYQTAYLRYYYPVEFIAGILSCERNKPDKVMKYLQIAKKMNITVLPPDVNESDEDFTIIHKENGEKAIRFGLGAIKRVGGAAVQSLIDSRGEDSFNNIFDLCKKIDLRKVNKGIIESLIIGGALDSVNEYPPEIGRASLLANVEIALKVGLNCQKEKNSNQISLFGMLSEEDNPNKDPDLTVVEPWSKMELFNKEKEVLGVYITGHPLEPYLEKKAAITKNVKVKLKEWSHTVGDLQNWETRGVLEPESRQYYRDIVLLAVVSSYDEKRTREKKERYGNGELDGMDGLIAFHIGSKILIEVEEDMVSGEALLISGDLEITVSRDGQLRKTFRIKKTQKLLEARKQHVSYMKINLETTKLPEFMQADNWWLKLNKFVEDHPGKVNMLFDINKPNRWNTIVELPGKVKLSNKLIGFFEQHYGEENIVYLKNRPQKSKDIIEILDFE
jgi:DNA polymerase III subunit alpha